MGAYPIRHRVRAILVALTTILAFAVIAGSASASSSWTMETFPVPPSNTYSGPMAVSCASPKWCMAAGFQQLQEPMAGVWNGSTWSLSLAFPASNDISQTTLGISCPVVGTCSGVDNGSAGFAEQYG